jgi:hypothetical protein
MKLKTGKQIRVNLFFNLYMKTKKLEPEKIKDYVIKQKIVSAEFFYFPFQK